MIYLTGGRGRLGSELARKFGYTLIEGDISDVPNLSRQLEKSTAEDVLINCAAFSAVDAVETEDQEVLDKAYGANCIGPGRLRQAFPGYMIHLSTGFVFNGKKGPYDETAEPNPTHNYGWSKWGGELTARMRPSMATAVVRTLDLFGENTEIDFVKKILAQLEKGEEFTVPVTLFGNPTYIPHIAQALHDLIEIRYEGILNYCGSTIMNRYVFSKLIAEVWGHDQSLVKPTDKVLGAATRPLNPSLRVERAKSLGLKVYTAKQGLVAMKKAMENNE